MPRFIIDYSANIKKPNIRKTLQELHHMLLATKAFKLETMKSRAVKHEDFFIADDLDREKSFVSVRLKLLSGREESFKKELAQKSLEIVKKYFLSDQRQYDDCNFTAFTEKIDRNSYSK